MSLSSDLVLPVGVSGFCNPHIYQLSMYTHNPLFFQLCSDINQTTDFRLLHSEATAKGQNFSYALFENKGFVAIMCNQYYPLIGYCAVPAARLSGGKFTDVPELDTFFEKDFKILRQDFLENPVNADNKRSRIILQNIGHEEFAQFAYWEPEIIGEIVFNRWGA